MPVWRLPALARFVVCALFAGRASPQSAAITGRVFDVYHRPVPGSRVVTIDRRRPADGSPRWIPGTPAAIVDEAGMYRLSLAPGRYILAVTPPPRALDFATVFPVYFPDTLNIDHAQPVELRPGEVRPFVDFLLLDAEPHRVSGRVTGILGLRGPIAVFLYRSTGYEEPLRAITADGHGLFQFDFVPAGSYELKAFGPIIRLHGLDLIWRGGRTGTLPVEVSDPEVTVQIPVRAEPR